MAVVGRREDGDESAVGEELVAVLWHLVAAYDQVKTHVAVEVPHDVGAEHLEHAARTVRVVGYGRVGVGPEQVAPYTEYVERPSQCRPALDLLRQTAVHAEQQPADARTQRHAVECRLKHLPHLHVEAVDLTRLVVPAQQIHPLVREQQRRRLR